MSTSTWIAIAIGLAQMFIQMFMVPRYCTLMTMVMLVSVDDSTLVIVIITFVFLPISFYQYNFWSNNCKKSHYKLYEIKVIKSMKRKKSKMK